MVMGKKLRTSQAAKRIGVHEDTVRRWVRQGQLPAYYTLGGHVRIDTDDLELVFKKVGREG